MSPIASIAIPSGSGVSTERTHLGLDVKASGVSSTDAVVTDTLLLGVSGASTGRSLIGLA